MAHRRPPASLPPGRADLHTHTTASDGALAPADLVTLARQRGLAAIAITDHDTVAGIPAAMSAAAGEIDILPGFELSCRQGETDVHLLGYAIATDSPSLRDLLQTRQRGRRERARRIVQRLDDLGYPVTLEQIEALADGAAIGRPHIARALVAAGHVPTVGDAFARLLANGRPAYVASAALSPADGIAAIHAAGGCAVLAHPLYSAGYETFLPDLIAAGLDGIEVEYPDHGQALRARLHALARTANLIATGGTDFHADTGRAGRGLGATTVPIETVAALCERAAGWRRAAAHPDEQR